VLAAARSLRSPALPLGDAAAGPWPPPALALQRVDLRGCGGGGGGGGGGSGGGGAGFSGAAALSWEVGLCALLAACGDLVHASCGPGNGGGGGGRRGARPAAPLPAAGGGAAPQPPALAALALAQAVQPLGLLRGGDLLEDSAAAAGALEQLRRLG
jgi:hypothetical protein